jgi:predicted nucleotide-binding protein
MPHITKESAVSILGKLIEREKPIGEGSATHAGWYRSVKLAVSQIFGNPSPQLEEIEKELSLSMQKELLIYFVDEIELKWDESGPAQINVSSPQRAVGSGHVEDSKKIFVVHGRNNSLRTALFQFLRAIGLKPVEWSQAIRDTGKASPYIGEVLDTAFSKAQAVVVLMTPDDYAFLREDLRTSKDPPYETQPTPQARPNVLFEAGMAMGWSSERTVLVEVGELRPFSDVGGRHVIRLNNSTERRQELAQRLESAGCQIDLSGTDWHREGDFNSE